MGKSALSKPKKNATKTKKKSKIGPNKVEMKHKSANEAKQNPFESMGLLCQNSIYSGTNVRVRNVVLVKLVLKLLIRERRRCRRSMSRA
ncbi:hypothetical protein Leryth_011709, partial [Lithospermum erythrorhizon]